MDKRYLWVVEVMNLGKGWEVYEIPGGNTRKACREVIAREKTWPNTGLKLRSVKYVPAE